jgi:hypothetical protein
MQNENKPFYLIWGVYTVALLIFAIFTDGSGGGGDSVLHYLYAKYAFSHPENFFNHWAKPLFTILASPFTLIGFTGIKLFNVACSSASVLFAFKSAENWNIKHRWTLAPIIFSSTLFTNVTLSGLTEPLSALILTSAIYFMSIQKMKTGLVIISFMPLVRSEGLILLGVFFIYIIIKRQYKLLPVLLTGQVIFAVAGYPYYKDLLWIFTKIPYANLTNNYGNGSWKHFLVQLNFQTNPVIYGLFWIGSLGLLFNLVISYKRKITQPGFVENFWLVYGSFYAFLFAHATFWALGIFNSMGLVRVFVSVLPPMGLICLNGFNFVTDYLNNKSTKKIIRPFTFIIVMTIVVFPFTKGKYGYNIPNDFVMSKEQKIIVDLIKPYLNNKWPDKTIVFTDPNIPFLLNIDPFDGLKCEWYYDLSKPSNLTSDKILIADTWFSKLEWGYSVENMLQDSTLVLENSFPEQSGIYYVFTKNNFQIP